jgi:hypothetical protein
MSYKVHTIKHPKKSNQRHLQQYFSYIMETSFGSGRSQSTRREPPTMGKQLVMNPPGFVNYKNSTRSRK